MPPARPRTARLEADRGDERVEPLAVRRAHVDAQRHARGNHVRRAGLDLEPPDGRDGPVDAGRRIAQAQHELRRGDERVRPAPPSASSRRARSRPRARPSPRAVAAIPVTTPSGAPAVQRLRPLLDVHLDERGRPDQVCPSRATATRGCPGPCSLPRRGTRRRPRALACQLGSLEPGEHTERAVEAAAVRHRVEMRAGPHLRRSGRRRARPKRLPAASTSTSSPASRIQPAASSCASFSSRVPPSRFAPAVADRVEPVEPLQNPHAHSLARSGRAADAREREDSGAGEAGPPRARGDHRREGRRRSRRPPPARSAASRARRRCGCDRDLGRGGEGKPVPGHRQPARDHHRGNQQHERRRECGRHHGQGGAATSRRERGPIREPIRSTRSRSDPHSSATPAPHRARRPPPPRRARARRAGRGRGS